MQKKQTKILGEPIIYFKSCLYLNIFTMGEIEETDFFICLHMGHKPLLNWNEIQGAEIQKKKKNPKLKGPK